jgi:RNA recognition motif-containing protein
MFGFVAFATAQEAREMVKVFDKHLFQGRVLRVEASEALLLPQEREEKEREKKRDREMTTLERERETGFQVHLAFSSAFQVIILYIYVHLCP